MLHRTYRCLNQQEFTNGNYRLVPLRDEDKYSIMQWRNDQMEILRQNEPLTREKQERYFKSVVDKLFGQVHPDQLLFSFLENDILIGYGGLVHIDWSAKNAEISFLTETGRSQNKTQFISDWVNYLKIVKKMAEVQLGLKKIYTYSYDVRPQLYQALAESNFVEEERMKHKVKIGDTMRDVVINSFYFEELSFRPATRDDVDLYFRWTNDELVRSNSFNSDSISYEQHCNWFYSKLKSDTCHFYLFQDSEKLPVGQVRIENKGAETVIGISVDSDFRGKSLSSKMLMLSSADYLLKHPDDSIVAYIKAENVASCRSFIASGFVEQGIIMHEGFKCCKLIRK